MVRFAGVGAAVLLLLAAGFQGALVLGAPLGEATMGGRAQTRDGVLEPRFRIAAAGSAVVLVFAAWIIAVRAGVLGDGPIVPAIRWATWGIAAYMLVNAVANFLGRHPIERWVMGPLTVAVAVLTAFVASGPT